MKNLSNVVGWKKFDEPRPYATIGGIAFDDHGRLPILYRGPNIRSAKNCWSLVTGLHEVGLTAAEQFAAELKEECGVEACFDTFDPINIGFFENIAPEIENAPNDPQWHWIIHITALRVKTLETFVNKEPDKHPEHRIVTLEELFDFIPHSKWAGGLGEFLTANVDKVFAARFDLCGF